MNLEFDFIFDGGISRSSSFSKHPKSPSMGADFDLQVQGQLPISLEDCLASLNQR